MTPEELKHIIAQGESATVEFKRSQDNLSRSAYETICAFLNRRGGHLVLGVEDNGTIVGINPDSVQKQLDTLARDLNNQQLFRPTVYIQFEHLIIDGKHVIYGYVPESGEGHSYKGIFYDRNQDGDFEIRSTQMIANLFIRKSKVRTENRSYPIFGMNDLEDDAFEYMRQMVQIENKNHPWLRMTNEQILRSGEMILPDTETGKEGLSLAAILLFGTPHAIHYALPNYTIDLLCRVNDTMLYDDRDLLKCNLMTAYPRIMDFIKKHLPEQPYIEDMQRFSLRDKILREVALNMLIHREYSGVYTTSFTIYRNRIVAENWNIPFSYGHLDLSSIKPHRKNPTIANVFTQMGIVEGLGSGTEKIFKYTPIYAKGQQPVITEGDVYRIEIPYIPTLSEGDTVNDTESTLKSALKTEDKILEIIKRDDKISYDDMADILEMSRRGIAKQIKKLQEEGRLRRVGPDKGGHWEVTES
jgi:ATP-dependent DNA helicase RecG